MKPYFADDHLTVYQGDARAVLAELPAESVHSVVTSPPYWALRDYGTAGQLGLESTPEEYVTNLVAVFREVRRVLRKDGTVWLNLGDSYAQSAGRKDADDGREAEFARRGKDRGYAPGSNFANYGKRMGEARSTVVSGLKPKDLVGIPWRVAFALQADGWYLRSDIIWAKPNPMPESVTDRPTKSHEYVFLLSKNARYYFDAGAVREPDSGQDAGNGFAGRQGGSRQTAVDGGEGSIERWRASKKPDGWATHHGGHGSFHKDGREAGERSTIRAGRNLRSVWNIATQPYPGAHFATFPEKLIEPCIKAGCPEGGVTLDPFAGSGTTGLVAQRLGRRAILIDLSMDYLGQLMARNAQKPLGLLG